MASSQTLIGNEIGVDFEDKLDKSNNDLRTLFQSVNFLNEQLGMADIIANPSSVTYGRKHKSSLHGFLHKMMKLFEPKAAQKDVKISMKGKSDAKVEVYNSFQHIPLILLDNAVKYSLSGREIIISINDSDSAVVVCVSSYGDIVPDDSKTKIFEKSFRASNVQNKNVSGTGMGLYLAQVIARAHGFSIDYRHSSSSSIGSNEFLFSVPRVL